MKKSIVSILASMIILPAFVYAGDATLTMDLNQGYVWRGITFNDGLVFQPSLDVSLPQGFGVNVWANMDIDDYDGAYEDGEFSEVDLTLWYGITLGKFELGAGFIEYLYPHQSIEAGEGETGGALPGSREIYATVAAPVFGGLSANGSLYYDIDVVEDGYGSLGISYSFTAGRKISAECGVSVGYAGKKMAAGGKEGWHEGAITACASYSLTDTVSLSVKAGYTDSIDDETLPDQDVNGFGGISMNWSL